MLKLIDSALEDSITIEWSAKEVENKMKSSLNSDLP